jgi:hypothetical protein
MFSWANKQLERLAETVAPPPVDPTTGTTSASHLFLTALNSGDSSGEMEALAIIRTNFSNGSFDPRMSLNVRGMTALHVASTKCASSIIRELLTNASIYGIDVNSTDSEGNTALHHAAASSTGGIDPNQSLSIVKLLVEEYSANVLWKNYNGYTPYDMARSQTVRGYLLPKQLQAEAALGIMDDNATTATTTSSLVNNNAGPPPTSIPIAAISNHIGGEEKEDVYDPVAALMRPTVGALGNVRNYTSVPSLSTSAASSTTAATTTMTMPTMMSSAMSSMQTPSFHQQHQEQDQEQLLQLTSNNDDATASVVHPSSSSSSSSSSSVLPEGWIECIDQTTNAIYYYNSITGVSSWDHPSSLSSSLIQGEGVVGGGGDINHYTGTIETNLQKDALPDGWIECVDPTNSNIVYYYNETTGVSQWDRPITTMEDDTPTNNNEGGNNVNWDTLQKDIAAITVTDDITNNDSDNIVVEDIVLTNANDVNVAKTVAEESIQSLSHTTNECFEQPAISSATTTALMSSFDEDDDDGGGDDTVVSPPPFDTTNDPSLATESLYHQPPPPPMEEEIPPPHKEVHDSSSMTPSIVTDEQKYNMPVKTTLFAITPPFVSVTTPKQPQPQQEQLLRPLLNAPSSGNTTSNRGRGGVGGPSATSTATSTIITATTRLQQSSAPTSGTGGGGYALRGGHANAAAAILSSSSHSITAPMSGGSVGSATTTTRPRVLYKPDGFHSSSNDRELQLKYGHVTNEHDQQRLALIGPPPTSLGVGGVGGNSSSTSSSSSTQVGGVGGVGGTSMPPVGGVGYANNNPYFASSSSSRYPLSAAPSSFGGYDPNNRGVLGATSSVIPAYATFQSPPPKDD